MSAHVNVDNSLVNRLEKPGFFKNALAWQGSVSKKVLPYVLYSTIYTFSLITILNMLPDGLSIELVPFEFSGVFIGLMLVFRINAGYDRWWEARKIWGSIVNQSRNLSLASIFYSKAPTEFKLNLTRLIALLPCVMRRSLRLEKDYSEVDRLGDEDLRKNMRSVNHWSNRVASEIAIQLQKAKDQKWMDGFSFYQAEKQRSILIDDIGACERILKTPMPYVYAVKLKRFIFIFLILLPFALLDRSMVVALLINAVVTYTMLSLDQIGFELQNPFAKSRLSHLPLDDICETIEKNVFEIFTVDESRPKPKDHSNYEGMIPANTTSSSDTLNPNYPL